MATAVTRAERVVLSHELSAFLVEFSIALHKHSTYPPGHPSLEPAASRVTQRAERLLEDRPTLAFGVARHQLIIDGVATDPNQPVLRRLAETLHRHHLGAMSILPGVESGEICGVLRALAREHDAGAPPRDLVAEWPHLRLHPLRLEQLELIDDEAAVSEGSDGRVAGRGAQLWIGLASAAMASDSMQAAEAVDAEPASVARAIDHHAGTVGYDQVIVGYLLQIADELKSASGSDLGALRRRTARLIAALRPETLQRLVTMGGNVAQRRAFVLGATSGMAVDSVVKILKAAADASGQTISHGLVRMLSKLATHAEVGETHVRPLADGALREQVDSLLSGWSLDDPNPDAYGKTLQHLATAAHVETGDDDLRSDHDAEPLRIIQMSLETGGAGPLVDRAIDRALAGGHIRPVRSLLASLPRESGEAAEILQRRLSDPRTVAALVAQEPLDTESLDAILPSISVDGYGVLVDALITAPTRATRRKLLDRLAQTDLDVAPLIAARLDDERWYVQRNLLLLLERLRRLPSGFSVSPWTRHEDARVRYQAISLQLTIPGERDSALRAALEDDDERVTGLGLLACQEGCPHSLIPRVAAIAVNPRTVEELKIHAVRALSRAHDRVALEALLRLVVAGKTVLGKPRLAPRTPLVLAAVRTLAAVWSSYPQVSEVLTLARGSSDPDLREAAQVGQA